MRFEHNAGCNCRFGRQSLVVCLPMRPPQFGVPVRQRDKRHRYTRSDVGRFIVRLSWRQERGRETSDYRRACVRGDLTESVTERLSA